MMDGSGRIPLTQKMGVCAVIVTFNPDQFLPDRVAEVARQVDHVIIVDDKSSADDSSALERLSDCRGVEILFNEANVGLGASLNRGVQRAVDLGFAWALTLDQDSRVKPSMVEGLWEIVSAYEERRPIGMIGVNYLHERDMSPAFAWREDGQTSREVRSVITSGSLLCLSAYVETGPFREDFFIDQIDHEYCLRLGANEYRILISNRPLMIHSVGNLTQHRFLWKSLRCTNHSPLRRYYRARNCVVLSKMYFREASTWVLRHLRVELKDVGLVLLFEDQKLRKLQAIGRGIYHGLVGQMGKADYAGASDRC